MRLYKRSQVCACMRASSSSHSQQSPRQTQHVMSIGCLGDVYREASLTITAWQTNSETTNCRPGQLCIGIMQRIMHSRKNQSCL